MQQKSTICKISWRGIFKLTLIVLAGVSGYPLWGNQEMTQNEIKSLLKNAVEYTINATFKSNSVIENGYDFPSVLYCSGQKTRMDSGKRINLLKTLGKGRFCWVEKDDGSCLANTIIYTGYQSLNYLNYIAAMASTPRLSSGNYSITDNVYKSIPCYKITVKYPSDDTTISQTSTWNINYQICLEIAREKDPDIFGRNLNSADFDANKELFKKNYFAVLEIFIAKTPSQPFIYSYNAYNLLGAKIYSFAWGTLEFPDKLDPALFELPKNSSVVTAKTPIEFSRIYMKTYVSEQKTSK